MASLALPSELDRLAVRAGSAKTRPDDVEAVHQLRVAARRVRAVAEQVGDGLGPSSAGSVEALAAAQRRLGSLRDADVLGERLKTLGRLLPPWWVGAHGLEALAGAVRVGEAIAVPGPEARRALVAEAAEAADEAGRRLREQLDQERPTAAERRGARRAARRSMARLAARLERRMVQVDPTFAMREGDDRPPAHRARIAAKRYRYVLEAFSAAELVEARPSLERALADLQDALGLGLDARRAQQALAEAVTASADETLAAVAWTVSAADAAHADHLATLAWRAVALVGSAATW